MPEETIVVSAPKEFALQKYQGLFPNKAADAAIDLMEEEYLPIAVKDHEDKKGYERAKEARISVKKLRCEVEATRKELKKDALEYTKIVDGEAKRLTDRLVKIETHLIAQEDVVAGHAARVKAEQERLAEEARVKREQELEAEGIRQAQERKRLEEEGRKIEAEKAAIEAEKRRQAQAKLDAEEAERRRVENEKRQKEEEERRKVEEAARLEEAKKKAAADAERKIREEQEAKEREARIAAQEEERRKANAPDKEKLLKLAEAIDAVHGVECRREEAVRILGEVKKGLTKWSSWLRREAEKL